MIQRAIRYAFLVGCGVAPFLAAVPTPGAPPAAEVSGASYRVRADATGVELVTARGERIHFGRPRLVTGSGDLLAVPGAPRRDGDRLTYDHGPWKEMYVARPDALQQMFLLERPIRTGASVRVPVRSDLRPARVKDGAVGFEDASGNTAMAYRHALALDAAGRVQSLALSLHGQEIGIELPKGFLEQATFPVLVDPLVGSVQTVSPAGEILRVPGVHLAWNPKDELYLAVWHQDVVFDDPPNNHGHPPHNWLTGSVVRARSIKIDAAGGVAYGDPITPTKPFVGIAVGPVATAGASGPFAAFAPRVTYNPSANEFLVVWSEGKWEIVETPNVDTDGDGLNGNDPDISNYGDLVTDLNDNISNTNTPNVNEFAYSQDPFPPNTRIVGRRVSVDPATLGAAVVGAAVEISMGTGGVPGNPNGPPAGVQDPLAIHPAVKPDVSWDGNQYVVVWQTLEGPTLGTIESIGTNNQEYRHIFYTQARARFRRLDPTGGVLGNPVDLANAKERFFVKGPTNVPANIVEGSVATNLQNEKAYESVPTDPNPHVTSLILPGPDGLLGTADDLPHGSLLVWNVTTLLFNVPKDRIRGRFLPAGSNTAGILWDIFSASGPANAAEIVQRSYVAAGPSKVPDNPSTPQNESLENSHFLVAWELVEDVVNEGRPRVEFVGSLAMRMMSPDGAPVGGVISLAASDRTMNRFNLHPVIAWNYEAAQYSLTWTQTDLAWNPITQGAAWHPASGSFTENQNQLFGTIATMYPAAASASYSSAVSPASPDSAPYHVVFLGQEDDFGANYLQRYKFPPTSSGSPSPTPPPGPSPPGGGGGSGGEGSECGCGSVLPLAGPSALALALGALATLLLGARRPR
jgi:hypothetical protein